MKPPIPNVIALGVLLLLTLATIYAGYIHGNMHLLTVLKRRTIMNLSLQEIRHILKALHTMSNHDVARAREMISEGVTDQTI